MTDLEMTKLCAEAMGIDFGPELVATDNIQQEINELILAQRLAAYDPLHNDAQAMALVKQFRFKFFVADHLKGQWCVATGREFNAYGSDLNRAIVECVAKMQSGRALTVKAK